MKIYYLIPQYVMNFSKSSRWHTVSRGYTLRHPDLQLQSVAVLEKAGHEIKFCDDTAEKKGKENVLKEIEKFKPDMLVVYCTTPSIYDDISYVKWFKTKFPNKISVVIGAHVTAEWEDTFRIAKNKYLDAVCIGEYDYTLRDLANKLPLSKCSGIAWLKKGKPFLNKSRPLIDVKELPFPAWQHIKPEKYPDPGKLHPFITLVGCRGCFGVCTFCLMSNVMYKHKLRWRTPQQICDEIEYDLKLFPYLKEIMFEDDTFGFNSGHTFKVCEEIIKRGLNKKISFACNLRTDCRRDLIPKLKEAGFRWACLPPDTLILTNEGLKPISEVKIGENVLTHKGRFRKVTDIMKRRYNLEIIKIAPRYLPPIKLTKNHPVLFLPYYTKDKKNLLTYLEWKKPSEIKEKGFLVIPLINNKKEKKTLKISDILTNIKKIKYSNILDMKKNGMSNKEISQKIDFPESSIGKLFNKKHTLNYLIKIKKIDEQFVKFNKEHDVVKDIIKLNKDFYLLAGYFAAEGSCRHYRKKKFYRTSFSFSNKEENYAIEVKKLLKKIFLIESKLKKRKNKIDIISNSQTLTNLFIHLFGDTSLNRKVPIFFLSASKKNKLEFIKGLFRGDAYPVKHKKTKLVERISFSTNSKQLFYLTYNILANLKIVPNSFAVTKKNKKNKNYVINVNGVKNLKNLASVYNLPLYKSRFNNPSAFFKEGFLFLPIKNISVEEYAGFVYNLEVKEDNSYTAGSLCVHNCVGFEFGTNSSLKAVSKNATIEQAKEFAYIAKKNNLMTHGCFMFGAPGETKEDCRATIDFAKSLPLDSVQFSGIAVYPGTPLYAWAKRNNYLVPKNWIEWVTKDYKQASLLNYPQLSNEDINNFINIGLKEWYGRPSQVMRLGMKAMKNKGEMRRIWHGFESWLRLYKHKNIKYKTEKC